MKILFRHVLVGLLAFTRASSATNTPSLRNSATTRALPTFARPRCGRHRPTMSYHSGIHRGAYQESVYAALACNHDASSSDMFHAFALHQSDDPERLRWYLRLTEDYAAQENQTVGAVLGRLMGALARGSDSGRWHGGPDPLALAIVGLFQPPVLRCVKDKQALLKIGEYRGEECDWAAERDLLEVGQAEKLVVERIRELREALERTLRAVEERDDVYLYG